MSRWKGYVAGLIPDAALALDVDDVVHTAELGAALVVLDGVRAWGSRLAATDRASLTGLLGDLEDSARSWGAP